MDDDGAKCPSCGASRVLNMGLAKFIKEIHTQIN
jgi:DNA-directed RNA polymerase subunit RPC12/RpoP